MKYLIAGLGNIGPEYTDTRHNIGFMVADTYVKEHQGKFSTDRLAAIAQVSSKGRQIFVIKPTTYMNLSGKAINYWMQQLKIPVSNLLVLVDELALPFESIKLKPRGSDGGHNGLKSVQAMLGTDEYARIRFGIGNNYPKGQQVNYVLSSFDPEEQSKLPQLIDKSVQMIDSFISIGAELTMTRFN